MQKPRYAHDDWMNDGPACKLAKTIQHILRITKRAQWQSSNNDFPFFGPRQDPKNEKPFVAAPLRDSLSRPLRSSSFGRNARWNLNLGSRFTNRKSKKKRKKKGTKSRKLSAHGRPTIAMIILRTCTESRAQRSFRKQITTATAKFEKSTSKARDEWHSHPFVSASPSISQILFPETGCHAKTRLPDQRLWQPARPYLLIINRHTRSILPILPSPIFKKYGKTGIPTHSFHDSHA